MTVASQHAGPIVVSGALGNVGSAVVQALSEREVAVRAADIAPDALTERFGPELDVARLDFGDAATFGPVLEGAKSVFLIRPPAISRVGPTLNRFIDAAVEAGVEHVVFSSVAGAESNRIVPHHRVEKHLLQSGLAWTMLRPGFFSQNIGSAYRQDIVEDDRIFIPAGEGKVAFIDARDIGDVAALALTEDGHRGQAYHLTGPEAMAIDEVAAVMSDVLGRTIRYEPASALGYFRHLRSQGLVVVQAVVQTILHVGLRKGDAEPVTDTVERSLGRPGRTVREYVTDHAGTWSVSSSK